MTQIAILGWGSLLWDHHVEFDRQHGEWLSDGPDLKLEFSRISRSRERALTLVIDECNGSICTVAYTISTRSAPDDAICDLRCREGTVLKNIGYYFADGSLRSTPAIPEGLADWAKSHNFSVVIWTALESNFQKEKKLSFGVDAAIQHIQSLPPKGRAMAFEYVCRAPAFIHTALRTRLEAEPWFPKPLAQS